MSIKQRSPLHIIRVGEQETAIEYFMFNTEPKHFGFAASALDLGQAYWQRFAGMLHRPTPEFAMPALQELEQLMQLAMHSTSGVKGHFAFPLLEVTHILDHTEQQAFYQGIPQRTHTELQTAQFIARQNRYTMPSVLR